MLSHTEIRVRVLPQCMCAIFSTRYLLCVLHVLHGIVHVLYVAQYCKKVPPSKTSARNLLHDLVSVTTPFSVTLQLTKLAR